MQCWGIEPLTMTLNKMIKEIKFQSLKEQENTLLYFLICQLETLYWIWTTKQIIVYILSIHSKVYSKVLQVFHFQPFSCVEVASWLGGTKYKLFLLGRIQTITGPEH